MRVPRATYRLQLGPGLTFDAAAALVDYLDALGVSDAYTSPFLETATRGSHGYDVADHDRLRAELGGEPAFQRLAAALGARGMGLLVDVVPNHMGIAQNRNAWWLDVLENGPASPYASTFDIDWRPVKTELTDKVLLPVLGDQYGAVLDRGELKLVLEDGCFLLRYFDAVLPIAPRAWSRILGHRIDAPERASEADRRERLDFVMRFQQITGPVTAKGFEDTALYRFNRPVSLNEVGGDPSRFGVTLAEFHAEHTARARRSPHALSATATHDTKRGEDHRARINVLSEIPEEWRRHVARWQRLNHRQRTMVDGRAVPGANTEYLIYQTLVGAWPVDLARLREYLLKAVHEAKTHTSWINPDVRYDEAIVAFAEALLDPTRSQAFLDDFTAFQARVAHFGALNSLAQTLIKITAPGVPDFYQGAELWDLSLVDPDNRRPVACALRRRLLGELERALASTSDRAGFAFGLFKEKEDGRVKLYIIREALALRRARPTLIAAGDYRALEARGALAEHLCAFARVGPDGAALTVVPRLLARRGLEAPPLGREYWEDTTLVVPVDLGVRFVDAFTGEPLEARDDALPLGDVLAHFPVALLGSDPR